MSKKFKVGDMVRVKKDTLYEQGKYTGCIGKIIRINKFIEVKFSIKANSILLHEEALELVDEVNQNFADIVKEFSVHNTTIDVKRKHYKAFSELIGNQFNHGGDKYNLPNDNTQEATDLISRYFGGESQNDWVLGTMMKYLFRFRNFRREKDLLKIATYCYILWLKNGFFLKDKHDEDTQKA